MLTLQGWSNLLHDPDALQRYGEYLAATNRELNAFTSLVDDLSAPTAPSSGAAGDAGGGAGSFGPPLPVAVKDNIAVAGLPLTCGSRMLAEFEAPYSATAVSRAAEAGYAVVGKTNLDEFGMGSSTTHSIFESTKNPWDPARVAGGSSGGSAAAVAAGMVPVALGSDTGGSVRQPAAFCGVYGLKPTYGAVSRYGLVAYASSFDVIGVLGREVAAVRSLFRTIQGTDPMDQTSFAPDAAGRHPATPDGATGSAAEPWRPRVVGVLSAADAEQPVRDRYEEVVSRLVSQGVEVRRVELPAAEAAAAAYYTIATAEASANLARYNGVRYGHRTAFAENPEELVRTSRTEGFGVEVKLRILLGTFVLRAGFQDKYYHRAQAVRRTLSARLHDLFGEVDLLLSPVYPTLPFPVDQAQISPIAEKIADRYTTLANLTRVPALSVPTGEIDGLPAAIQVMAPPHAEERLLDFAEFLAPTYPPAPPPNYPGFGAEGGGSDGSGPGGGGAGGRTTGPGGAA
ncbi:MAG: amidase family protein [bacterium]